MSWQEYAERQQFARQTALQESYEQSLIPPEPAAYQENEPNWQE